MERENWIGYDDVGDIRIIVNGPSSTIEAHHEDQPELNWLKYDAGIIDPSPYLHKVENGKIIDRDEPLVHHLELDYADKRRLEILETWPMETQLEAMTEAAMGRPEKLEALKLFLVSVKDKHPKD